MTKTSKPPNLPYGLNPKQLEHLRSLKGNRSFDEFTALVDHIAKLHMEDLLAATDEHTKSYYQGLVTGLRFSSDLLDRIISITEKEDAREARQRRQQQRSSEQQRTALFGTRFWAGRSKG